MTTYFKSDKVRVFPSAYRGTDTNNKMYNPESRLQTEFNTTLKKYLVDTNGFVIDYKDNHIKFILEGYYFDIDISDITDRSYLAVKLILDTLHTAENIHDYTEIALHADEVTNFAGLLVYDSSSTAEERKSADFVLLENNKVPESSKFKYNSDSIIINNRKLTDLFEANGYIKNATNADKAAKADNATNATNADSATTSKNVSSTINSKNISDIFETNGTTVKKATNAETAKKVTDNIGNFAISTIFEDNSAKVRYAKTADKLANAVGADDKPVYVDSDGVVRVCTSINVPGSITDAGNVTSSINNLALTEIFNYDAQGITRYVKNALAADVATTATNAVEANKVKNKLTINLQGGAADTSHVFDGSEARTVSFFAPTYIGNENQFLTVVTVTGTDKKALSWSDTIPNASYLQYTSLADNRKKQISWNPSMSADISTTGGDAGLVIFGGSTVASNSRYLYAKAFKDIDVGSLLNRTSSNITDKSLYYIQDIEFEDNQTYIATLRSNNNGNALLEPTHTDNITVGNATNATNSTNVTSTINGKNISDIFETDMLAVKNATTAAKATTTSISTGGYNTKHKISSGDYDSTDDVFIIEPTDFLQTANTNTGNFIYLKAQIAESTSEDSRNIDVNFGLVDISNILSVPRSAAYAISVVSALPATSNKLNLIKATIFKKANNSTIYIGIRSYNKATDDLERLNLLQSIRFKSII